MFQTRARLLAEATAWLERALLDAVVFLVAFVFVAAVGKFVLVPVVHRALETWGFDGTVVSLGESIANATVWLVAGAVAFTVAGFGSFLAAFATFGSAIALVAGFVSRELLGNVISGVFILKDEPFEAGDWIEWNDNAGWIEEIDLRVSRVRTFNNELITVPNGELANNAVTNPVAHEQLRQEVTLGIGYDEDLDHAIDLVTETARTHTDILADPSPSVRVTELGSSAVELEARFWLGVPDYRKWLRVRSEFVRRIKRRFQAEGIEMPYDYRHLTGEIEVSGPGIDESRAD